MGDRIHSLIDEVRPGLFICARATGRKSECVDRYVWFELPHRANDSGGIDTARQRGPKRYIAAQMESNIVEESFPDLFNRLREGLAALLVHVGPPPTLHRADMPRI